MNAIGTLKGEELFIVRLNFVVFDSRCKNEVESVDDKKITITL